MTDRDRRRFLTASATCLGALAGLPLLADDSRKGPAVVRKRPEIPFGVASGDVSADGAILWSRSDRPARMIVELGRSEAFRDARRIVGPAALADGDFTARVDVGGLPAGEEVFYRVRFVSLEDRRAVSEPVIGRFRTPPADRRAVKLVWSGDTCGQGWGIDTDRGGMALYESMRQRKPDLMIHSGDIVYADNPLTERVELPDGSTWKNLVTPAKRKVAETLDEFRGQYRYNLHDANLRRFNAEVPLLAQWDDHETVNNWYPGEQLEDRRYQVKSVDLLAARAKRAFFDYLPIRPHSPARERIYRRIGYGPHLDVMMLDMRSYRGPNSPNRQPTASAETQFLGADQLAWLKRELLGSRATWKLIASDMPIGLLVRDGKHFENGANGDGPPLGRELELAELLRFIKRNRVRNVVWVTADVHYTAAHYYDPDKATFQDFDPFWEFVAGPIHAGTFGPGKLDGTFGPQPVFQKAPPKGQANLAPSAGLQFFGEIAIDRDGLMTVGLRDRKQALYTQTLEPSRA